MRSALRWTGFLLVAGGIAVFPFAIWLRGPWGVIALVAVAFGCLVLVAALAGQGGEPPDESEP